MKLRMIFLLFAAVLLAACGLGSVDVSVGEPTMESAVEPQVVTVVVVATPTPEPIVASPSASPSERDAPTEPTATEPANGDEIAGTEVVATSEPPPSLPTGSWQPLDDLPRYINDLVADPHNPQILYAGTGSSGSGSGIYKSKDGGLTWQLAASGLPSEDVAALALSSTQPPLLYALVGVRGDVYVSADGAQSWTHLGNSGLFGGFEHWLHVDPIDSNVIFALAKSNKLTRSSDSGSTWLPFGEGLPRDEHSIHILSLAIDPANSNVIFAGTGGHVGGGHGVYKTTDGGQTWSAVNQGMLDYRITALAVDPVQSQTVYAGTDDGTLFKTADGGQTWQNLSDNMLLQRDSYPSVQEIILDSSERIFLLVERAGVFVSQDGGQTWQPLGNPGESGNDYSTMALVSGSEPVLVIGARRENGGWRYASSVPETTMAETSTPSLAESTPDSPTDAPTSDEQPKLEMSTATLVIAETELADRFPLDCSFGPTCSQAKEGHQLLIVWLEGIDGSSLGEIRDGLFGETIPFLTSDSEAYVTADDGARAGLAIAQVSDDGDRFALVFILPDSAHSFQLNWPDNPVIDLGK